MESQELSSHYTPIQVFSLFQMGHRFSRANALSSAEQQGKIPPATRIKLGKHAPRRCWRLEQLPAIGKLYGFLKPFSGKQKVISVFTPQERTLKTTLTHALARVLALHGIRVLVIGLDLQGSLTQILLAPPKTSSLEESMKYFKNLRSIAQFFTQPGISIQSLIQKTNLPTLDLIPETLDLEELLLFLESKPSSFFRDELLPHLHDYEVVLWDPGPRWNALAKQALGCSHALLQPIACKVRTFQGLEEHQATLEVFRNQAGLSWEPQVLIPTLKDTTTLSQQIYGAYLSQYPAHRLISTPLRKSILGHEALSLNQSPLEYDPHSDLAQDYVQVLQEIWDRVV